MRTCVRCNRTDPPCGYYETTGNICADCKREAERARYRRKVIDPAYLERQRARQRSADKPRAARMRKTARFRQRYGIDLDTYELMRDEREGRCDICHRSAVLRVDHDHVTGVVRGLLCDNCNLILGHARDDVTVLASAITYLKEK